ncbi:GTPase family protein [Streptomyces sp. NPDC001922]|uniref:GTPase family protein n=1 Tax=Streptomyces sp. NPDC001922 TaxID=3364624 RepID=UPI0036926D69
MDKDKTFLNGMFGLTQTGKAPDALRRILGDENTDKLTRLVAEERAANPPRVAVIGKAGVGKTTTINNLFSAEFKVSHALRGTSEAQLKEFALRGGGALHILDMPGLGEGIEEDRIFEGIYREHLPQADVVLYVLEATERLLGEDQRIFNDVILPILNDGRRRRLVIGLNKVDLIGPGSWDATLNFPDVEQEKSIDGRCRDIARKLARQVPGLRAGNIAHYSAERRYRLDDLLITLIKSAGKAAWKLPVDTADPFELAAPEVQEYVARRRAEGHGSGKA